MAHTHRLGRRAALLLPLGAAGCSLLDDWFGDKKTPLPGTRVAIMTTRRGLRVDNPAGRRVKLPPPAVNPDWPQAGSGPAHVPGHPAVRDQLAEAWTAEIGAGGGYRRRLTARPVIGGGRVFVMDSDAVISAFDARHGNRLWRVETSLEDEDSTNVGGGIALDGPTLYAATGLASVLAIEASSGKGRWRQKLPTPARAAPTIAEDRLYIPTLDEQVLALAKTDGKRIWSYQGPETQTAVLGLPSPAYADGLLVAGFGTGELVCLSAASGAVSWSDGLASARGLASPVDLSSIPGLPVISQGQVYAVGLGGLFVALDLRSGRRLWEREVASEQTPWLAGDWLFVLTPDQVLGAINRQDGTVAWVSQLPLFQDEKAKEDPITWVGPVLAGDRLIVAGSSKEALAVSPYTGAVLGRQELRGKATLAPVVAGGTVFLITDDATLLALR